MKKQQYISTQKMSTSDIDMMLGIPSKKPKRSILKRVLPKRKGYKKPVIKVGKFITELKYPYRTYKIVHRYWQYTGVIPSPHIPNITKETEILTIKIRDEFRAGK